jgi:hypothetical protein
MEIIAAILTYMAFIALDALAMAAQTSEKEPWKRLWYMMPGYGIWLWIKAKEHK